jgi:hypothetical protein
MLEKVKAQIGVPVLTDVHEYTPLAEVAAWWTCCKRPRFCAARPISSERHAPGQAGQYQKRPVPVAVGDEPTWSQSAQSPATTRLWCANAALPLATIIWCPICAPDGDARHRLSGGVRRHPLGAIAGRAGPGIRRSARVCAGAGAGGSGGGHRRAVHGNPSRSGPGAQRWAQRLAAGSRWNRCWRRSRRWTRWSSNRVSRKLSL